MENAIASLLANSYRFNKLNAYNILQKAYHKHTSDFWKTPHKEFPNIDNGYMFNSYIKRLGFQKNINDYEIAPIDVVIDILKTFGDLEEYDTLQTLSEKPKLESHS